MEIADSFRVSTPIADTWKVLLDIEGIAPCLPGAQLQEIDGNDYKGVVKVKVGPITAQYKGTATLTVADEAAHRIVLDASGRDTCGQGNAKAQIVVTMNEDDGGTRVDVVTDLAITGQGRGVRPWCARRRVGEAPAPVRGEPGTRRASSDAPGAPRNRSRLPSPRRRPTASRLPPDPGRSSRPKWSRSTCSTWRETRPPRRLIPIAVGAVVLFLLWRLLRSRS